MTHIGSLVIKKMFGTTGVIVLSVYVLVLVLYLWSESFDLREGTVHILGFIVYSGGIAVFVVVLSYLADYSQKRRKRE